MNWQPHRIGSGEGTYDRAMALFCPICKRPLVEPPANADVPAPKHFPFCSERCKLIDLGRWLDGKYQVPVVEDDLDEAAGSDKR
jgi:endogenous inhibitor of DNA gyrase (YacG/DUF329 family)